MLALRFGVLLCSVLPLAWSPAELPDELGAMIKAMESRLPGEPAVIPNRETLDVLMSIARTRELRAACLLIKALVWNSDPLNQDERLSDAQMLPAAPLLKEYFGEPIAPLLLCAFLEKPDPWFGDRVVVALKYLVTTQEIERWIGLLSLTESKLETTQTFVTNLRDSQFRIKLARPTVNLGPRKQGK